MNKKEIDKLSKELKEKHGVVYRLDIPTDEGDKVLFLRKLDRVTYSAGIKLLEKNELTAAEMFLRALTVGGDDPEEIISDFDALRIASTLLASVIGTKTGNVAKL